MRSIRVINASSKLLGAKYNRTSTVAAIQQFTGVAGPLMSIGLYASPVAIAREIQTKKSTGQYSAIPYLSMFGNCSLWVDYGTQISNYSIILPNAVGMALSVGTLAIFLQYTPSAKKSELLPYFAGTGLGLSSILGYVHFVAAPDVMASQLGLIASVICVAMFSAPLATVREVVRDKSSASLPTAVIVMSNLNCACWLAYGICLMNPYVYVPNFLGLALSMINLALCIIYPKK
eukprot:NODE_6835_length_838_cov_54.369231_g6236_i0.p1 GENE.NODE_6835_length_838_cov_54.369231_g6236_i0~~NODE_6835_length_838_cov_54.369231_g6236_i0.p1  ORF type:complete len:233 (-),score=16.26 NODE_6835_length_838_cov_54.369231_g6236_i0:85-783(-)